MKRREISGINIALLDILTGALGAVIILYVAVPKGQKAVQEVANVAVKNDKEIESRYEELKAVSAKIAEKLIQEQKENEKLSIKARASQDEIASLKDEIQKLKSVKAAVEEDKDYRGKGLPVDVGFKFKGKKIVFLIDVSGSMNREDRIGQVKAGLKMLVTSMPKEYELDVVQFPGVSNTNFRPMWGGLRNLESFAKDSVYNFLLKLRARGYTPTREVLTYALTHYNDLSDIVLLTDGAPTLGNSSKEASISQILLDVQRLNRKKKVRINTIGVGSSFVRNRDSKAYVFLQELAKDHGGFFYGF